MHISPYSAATPKVGQPKFGWIYADEIQRWNASYAEGGPSQEIREATSELIKMQAPITSLAMETQLINQPMARSPEFIVPYDIRHLLHEFSVDAKRITADYIARALGFRINKDASIQSGYRYQQEKGEATPKLMSSMDPGRLYTQALQKLTELDLLRNTKDEEFTITLKGLEVQQYLPTEVIT